MPTNLVGKSAQVKEGAVTGLAELYAKQKDAQALRSLLSELRPLFAVIPKVICRGIAYRHQSMPGVRPALHRKPEPTRVLRHPEGALLPQHAEIVTCAALQSSSPSCVN